MINIIEYKHHLKNEWNGFVNSSKNGTFMLLRDYIEYHKDRFVDNSLLFYDRNKLIAVLPANISDNCFYSHQGLTYGGLVLSFQTTAQQVLDMMNQTITYLSDTGAIDKIIYRTIPYIYHKYPSEEDLYALFRNGASLIERKISSAIYTSNILSFRTLRKRQIKRAKREELKIHTDASLSDFWPVLDEVLNNKYYTKPAHSLQEISLLKNMFPENIYLYCVSAENNILAGTVVYETETVAHIQYIAANPEGKEKGALDLLFDYLINTVYHNKRYIDFGVSVEKGGWLLNEGLQFQKEGFGGRAVVYDTYMIKL